MRISSRPPLPRVKLVPLMNSKTNFLLRVMELAGKDGRKPVFRGCWAPSCTSYQFYDDDPIGGMWFKNVFNEIAHVKAAVQRFDNVPEFPKLVKNVCCPSCMKEFMEREAK